MVQVLLMNGLHTQLMKIGLLEALANVVLSVILVKEYGMIGAAIGTLIPNVLLALFYNIPVALKYSSTHMRTYIKEYLLPLFISFSTALYLGYLLQDFITPDSILKLMLNGSIIVLLFASLYALLAFKKELKLS